MAWKKGEKSKTRGGIKTVRSVQKQGRNSIRGMTTPSNSDQ